MKKLKTVLVAALAALMISCAGVQLTDKKPCDRKVWFSGKAHDLACLGEDYLENDMLWRNVGEIINPELPHVLVIFWDNTNDCEADVANMYIFHKATDEDNSTGLDVYFLNGAVNVENILDQIETAHINNPEAGHLDALKWLDCEPHSKNE